MQTFALSVCWWFEKALHNQAAADLIHLTTNIFILHEDTFRETLHIAPLAQQLAYFPCLLCVIKLS